MVLPLVNLARRPKFHGHTVSYWIDRFGSSWPAERIEAHQAIREAGSNALPCIIRCLEYKPYKWRLWLTSKRDFYGFIGWIWVPEWATAGHSLRRVEFAKDALALVGSEARPAIPHFVRLAREEDTPRSDFGVWALGTIGNEGVQALLDIFGDTNAPPHARGAAMQEIAKRHVATVVTVSALIKGLSDRCEGIAQCAAVHLGIFAAMPERSVSALQAALQDRRAGVRADAASALGRFGSAARPALPALLRTLNDADQAVRDRATNAFLKIAPEALTNAPAQ